MLSLPTAELHLHTAYSFSDGASQPEELVARAQQLGYRALAVTDHDGLHGAMAFAQACKAAGIQPITGVELTLRRGIVAPEFEVHLTLLAASADGYANLCALVSAAHKGTRSWEHKEPWRGRGPGVLDPELPPPASGEVHPAGIDPAFLEGRTADVVCLTGCRHGELARLVDAGRLREAGELLERLKRLFGAGMLYVELQQNLVQGDTQRIAKMVRLAREHGLPVVATGDVHYHDRSRHRLHDALTAVRHRTTLEASHQLRRANSEFYLRPPAEVAALFADYPEAIASQARIAERCRGFDLAEPGALRYEFPDFTRAPGEEELSADEVLRRFCMKKLEERYGDEAPDVLVGAIAQLADELRLIAHHKLSGFFLIYRDLQILATEIAQKVRGEGTIRGGSGLPPGRGRGSSVSSIVCYLIGLSHVDPVKTKLFFKRFLNEDLRSIPDIDLDFAREIREALILAVYERFGAEHAALVCNFATYHLRSAVRDLGKVLGLPEAAIDKLAKLSEGGGADTVRREIERLPELTGQAVGPLWDLLVDLAAELDGLPRHMGQHVGGMIIASQPMHQLVAVQPGAIEGRYVCQWDKDSVDDARFVKIDFLALGMLSLVEECLELIHESQGTKVDLSRITYDEAEVYDQICAGDTVGTFQIESRAQIQMLTRTRPRTLNDLAVQVAIVRPGPIVGGAVNPYVRRRERMRLDPRYRPRADHPMLDDVLADTLGVVLFQDQVLEVAVKMGKFTPGQADAFRRAMSRRRSAEVMESFRTRFLEGATSQGVTADKANEIFDKLRGFSEFGFPKSHAHAFAVLAYQSAWLRHYYPAAYYAALLNNQPMGFYAPHVLVGDARRHGITVLRPSVNRSEARTVPNGTAPQVRLGLGALQGLGEELAKAIVAERRANGPFRSLRDLIHRTGMPRDVAANLIAVGALADFGLSRRELLWQLGLLIPEPRTTTRQGQVCRQLSLGLPTEQDHVVLPDMTEWERMVADYGLLQLSPSYHPMGLARPHLPGDLLTAARLREMARPGAPRPNMKTGGLVVCRQRPGTAKGFVFLLVEDETGLTNVVVRPDLYEAERSVVRGSPYLWIEGTLRLESGSLNLIAERIKPLEVPARAVFSSTSSFFMPRPTIRHMYPGNPHDPREAAAAEANPPPTPPPERVLAAVAPASHDFH